MLELAKQLGNVSPACKVMGYSRDSFYRVKQLYEQGGSGLTGTQSAQAEQEWGVPGSEETVGAMALAQAAWGQVGVATALAKRGVRISAAGVRCGGERQELENLHIRPKVLEAKVAQAGQLLSEAQRVALEKAKADTKAPGACESEGRGYWGAQDTFYVGMFQGGGRLYQQTFIDTYSKGAFAKLSDCKTPLTAADLLNDQLSPFLEAPEVPLSRVLPDRGTEYGGSPAPHEYELYLAVERIDHTRTKAKSAQTKGICERFYKPVLTEFYRLVFRNKFSRSLEELQADLELWPQEYTEERPHQGRWCYGKVTVQMDRTKVRQQLVATGGQTRVPDRRGVWSDKRR